MSEALLRGLRDRLLFIDFDRLTQAPEEQMRKVYEFVEETYFPHDFSNVRQVTQEEDVVQGYFDLHRIREKVHPVPADAKQILGEQLFRKYSALQLRLPGDTDSRRILGRTTGGADGLG